MPTILGKQIGDTDNAIVALLEVIARNTGNGPDTIGEINFEQSESGNLRYVTSGPTGMEIPADWEDLPLPFTARVLNFRFTHDMQLAFRDPDDRPDRIIPLPVGDSPFTIGDASGVNADTIWLRADPDLDLEENDPVVDFIAYL